VSDRRLTPATDRVVLAGHTAPQPNLVPTEGRMATVSVPLANLLAAPGGSRDRQVLLGEGGLVLEDRDGWSFIMLDRDGYVGWIETPALGAPVEATHRVAVRATHVYAAPDIKSPDLAGLSFGARLRIVSETDRFKETHDGRFVPKQHLRGLGTPFRDPVTIAQLFFGTPYLWGGNSAQGIDCSGLVQAALLACGIPCPGDSDLQEAALGTPLPEDAPVERGDLFFWRGHVAIAVDGGTLIHANAHHMAVAYEPLDAALRRIDAQGGGPLTSRRRIGA
jgi:hypothetical protein